jgi:hypothetical protein
MAFTNKLKLKMDDKINDEIWINLNTNDRAGLNLLDAKYFSIDNIIREINTGCSPCPDILTENFGSKPSVMFVSTVYGLVNKYLKQEYDRSKQDWNTFCNDFYKKIIQSGTGIYKRLDKIYRLLAEIKGRELDFCFTELVKTVLVDHDNKVSGLGSKGSFIKYFEEVEFRFLEERINQIKNECFIFSFSEEVTYFLIKIFNKGATLEDDFNILHTENKKVNINIRIKRNGDYQFNIEAGGTYSNSVAFKTVLKVKDKKIYIIPLPHPSTANNKYWQENQCWGQLKELLKMCI